MSTHSKIAVLELATEPSVEAMNHDDLVSDSAIMRLLDEESSNVDIIRTPIANSNRHTLEVLQAHVLELHQVLRNKYKAVLCLSPEKLLDPLAQAAYFSSPRALQGDTAVLFADERVRAADNGLKDLSLGVLNTTGMSGKVGVLYDGGIYAVPRLDPDDGMKRSAIAKWDQNWKFTSSKPHHQLLDIAPFDLQNSANGVIHYGTRSKSVNEVVAEVLANQNIAATLWQPEENAVDEVYDTLSQDARPSIMVEKTNRLRGRISSAALTTLNARSAYGILIAYVLSATRGELQDIINQYELSFQVL